MAILRWLKKNLIYILVALAVIGGLLVPVLSHPDTVVIEGNIKYIDLEGGFWGIVGTDGINYDPVNLDKNNKTDGQLVKVRAEILKDQTNVHQWGTLIKIVSIQVITTTNN